MEKKFAFQNGWFDNINDLKQQLILRRLSIGERIFNRRVGCETFYGMILISTFIVFQFLNFTVLFLFLYKNEHKALITAVAV